MSERARRRLRSAIEPARLLLEAHAQLLFARSRLTGALLMVAVALDPRALVSAGLALLTTTFVAELLGFGTSGAYGCNALLLGIGLAHHFAFGIPYASFVVVASIVLALVTAALSSALGRMAALPVLSLPFVCVLVCADAVAPQLGLISNAQAAPPIGQSGALVALRALGALLFAPHAAAGILVLAALLAHSRIAASLGALSLVLVTALASSHIAPATLQGAALNATLAVVAVGSVWFVPSRSAFAVGACAATIAAALALTLSTFKAALATDLLILPFNVSVLVVLFAMRQRAFDRNPKSVDFASGTPEENLAYYQTRLARFDDLYAIPFGLPFTGAWTCTQGVDGAHTHQGPWRHAFDFEVFEDGAPFRGAGEHASDHFCYQLPVVAAADGTVVTVIDDVPDNRVGGMDLERNWGNVVVLQHGPALYSLVAHLAPGSVAVALGAGVRRGDLLGRCGSSGRAPRPHLHFQLQSTPLLGAPTLPCRFRDIVMRDRHGEERLARGAVPRERDELRNIEPDEAVAARCRFVPGSNYVFRSGTRVEQLVCEVDLLGTTVLRSPDDGARLTLFGDERGLTTYDVIAPPRSVLHLLRAALSRVPFDGCMALSWSDYLPVRGGSWMPRRPLGELASVFVPSPGLAMEYRRRFDGSVMVVTGHSKRRTPAGVPLVQTRADLLTGIGPVSCEVVTPNGSARFERVLEPRPVSVLRNRSANSAKRTVLESLHEGVGESS